MPHEAEIKEGAGSFSQEFGGRAEVVAPLAKMHQQQSTTHRKCRDGVMVFRRTIKTAGTVLHEDSAIIRRFLESARKSALEQC
jgi:hypothetical protein